MSKLLDKMNTKEYKHRNLNCYYNFCGYKWPFLLVFLALEASMVINGKLFYFWYLKQSSTKKNLTEWINKNQPVCACIIQNLRSLTE